MIFLQNSQRGDEPIASAQSKNSADTCVTSPVMPVRETPKLRIVGEPIDMDTAIVSE